MIRLDGKAVSQSVRGEIQQKVDEFKALVGRPPGLSVILVGDDPASQVYVRNKERACEEVGISSEVIRLEAGVSKEELQSAIESLNKNSAVDGILVQLPLPKSFNEDEVIGWIDPIKDVDALTVENIGLFAAGRPRVISCTPHGVMKILEHYDIDVAGKSAVVVGRSQIVGLPMARLLQNANATVTVCHSKTPDVSAYTKNADIIVVAAGVPKMLGKGDFSEKAVVIDVGIHRDPENPKKLCGDVRFDELEGEVYAATPVPGGVGPMTITMLLESTLALAKLRL